MSLEDWYPERRPGHLAWAVNARVLSLEPLGPGAARGGSAQDGRAPTQDRRPGRPEPRPAADPGVVWNNAPAPLDEWTGRERLLDALDRDWADPERQVSGLIGFGGEGKSSLARKWVDEIIAGTRTMRRGGRGMMHHAPTRHDETPDRGVLVGLLRAAQRRRILRGRPGLHERRPDRPAGVALGGHEGPGDRRHVGQRPDFLFVLDGLEVMQHQAGDRYGLLRSNDLRDFLALFAAPGHESFCLVTSRAPLLDLMEYTTYNHRDVDRLSPAEGRDLLRNVGVHGEDADLEALVADWDGHALTLGLVGAYLAWRHGGDVARARRL